MENKNIEEQRVKKEELNGCQQTMLDIFRILAALFVVVGHSFSFYQITVFKDQTYFPYIQNIGVVIFFLLSGFLTAFSVAKKNRKHQYSFSQFLKHKSSRIAKEYLPGLMLIAIIDFISIAINGKKYAYFHEFNIMQFVGNALMLHNMGAYGIMGRYFVPFGSGRPLWTLAVEWWLYMLFGVLYFSLSNREKVTFSKALLFGTIVFMCSEYLITGRGSGLGFVFLLGVLSFYCYHLLELKVAMVIFPLSCIVYIVYGAIIKEAYTVYSYIILWFILCSALKIRGGIKRTAKRNPVLAFISKSTFMLYLVHYSIIDLIFRVDISWSIYLKFVTGIVISWVISFFFYYIFGEKNLMGIGFGAIRNKFFKQ